MVYILRDISKIFVSKLVQSTSIQGCRNFFWNRQTPPAVVTLRAAPEDHDAVFELMKKIYFREEPTCAAIGYRPNPVIESQTYKMMNEGVTIVAKCRYTGEIVGACINESTNPWDADLKDRLACIIKCPKTKRILHFHAYLQRVPNLWERYKVLKVFEMGYLFVARDHRGKGLGRKLMEDSRRLAADCGYRIIRVDATSFYSAKLCEKLKMDLICDIPYRAYVDSEEKPVFTPLAPHTSVKIFVQDLAKPKSKKKGK